MPPRTRRAGSRSTDRSTSAMGGFAPSFNEVNDQTREDLTKAELIAFPVLAILLLLVFRGVVAALIPLLIGVISILGTFLVLRVMSEFVDTSLFALNIATALSLGLAVDYALLLVSRYREEIERRRRDARGAPPDGDDRRADGGCSRASPSPSAMAALIVLPQRFLYSVGAAGAAVGVLSAAIALLVVPSLLALLGTRINALLDPPRARRLGRVGRLVPARVGRDAPAGRGRAGQLRAAARGSPRRCCRPSSPGRAPRPCRREQPSYDANSTDRGPLPARRQRGDHGDGRRAAERRSSCARAPAADRGGRGDRRRDAVRARVEATSPTRTSPPTARRCRERPQDAVDEIRADGAARRRAHPRLGQHGALHRPEAEPRRPPARC